jgi:hypothetical protein
LECGSLIVSGIDRKRWAQKAQALKFTQLDQMRAHAEKWRNGLVTLTALFATVAIIKGPDLITAVAPATRTAIMFLLGAAFLSMLAGSLLAMRASFGLPGAMLVTGENLEAWERSETNKAVMLLAWARPVFLVGILFLAAGFGVIWTGQSASPGLIAVQTDTGETVCGALVDGSDGVLQIESTTVAGRHTQRIRVAEVVSLNVVVACK